MKIPLILIIGVAGLIETGCANPGVVSIGKDTYMVNTGGWPAMNGFRCENEAYREANEFCSKHHLQIASTQPTTVDGQPFVHNASCKLVFVATNAPFGQDALRHAEN